jgi:hypothetical protein
MSEGQVKNASKLLEEASKNSTNKEKVLDALLAAVDTAESAGLQGAEGISKGDPALEEKVKEFKEITSETANTARGKILSLREGPAKKPENNSDGWESSSEVVPPMHPGPRWHGPRGRLAALHGMTSSLMGHAVGATKQINNPAQLKIILGVIQLLIRQVNTLATRTNELGKRMGRLEEKLKLPLTPSPNIPLLSEQHAPQQYADLAYKRGAFATPEISSTGAPAPEASATSGPAAKGGPSGPKAATGPNAKKNAAATGNAKASGNASGTGNAKASGNASGTGNAKASGNASGTGKASTKTNTPKPALNGKSPSNSPNKGNAKPGAKSGNAKRANLTRRNKSQRRVRASRRQRR